MLLSNQTMWRSENSAVGPLNWAIAHWLKISGLVAVYAPQLLSWVNFHE